MTDKDHRQSAYRTAALKTPIPSVRSVGSYSQYVNNHAFDSTWTVRNPVRIQNVADASGIPHQVRPDTRVPAVTCISSLDLQLNKVAWSWSSLTLALAI